MGKGSKKARKNTSSVKVSIQELKDSRNGGQVALRGYSYQFLYSCYLILSSSSSDISFQLEGVEDIDFIEQKDTNSNITHIQLKYSTNKQNASFLSSVLKNFLETYLLDQNRYFKLVYDFPVAEGHLDKLIASNLDENSRAYWVNVISDIQKKLPSWNWSAYDFDSFISHLSFEKVEKSTLADEIEKALIKTYDISTDNIALFANSIKVLCFEKMEFRAYVTKTDLDLRIQSVLIDISKGVQNPAHSWIRKLDYSIPYHNDDQGFYEGKKSTPVDIACGLPVKRPSLEKDVIHSICENTITVIKASSGQGKTTLALQIAYELKNEYVPYQLLHEFLPVDSTAISVIKITEKADLPTLFSHLPEFALNKEDFCHNAVDALWNEDDLSNYIPAIRGLFSGSVMQYYLSNKAAFDDANIHGGLPILLTEVCPFTKFTEFGVSVDTFATLQKVEPENKNIKYLCNLRDNIPTYSPKDTLIYVFCTCLYRKLFPLTWGSIKDITSYAAIAEWLYNMNPEFNLSVNFPLDDIWASSKRLSLECISTLMYISYCGNKDVYTIFVTKNLSRILTYLKHQTKSYELFVDFKNNAIHVSYILPLCEVRTSNEQSVSRLKCICKTLPIFDLYCADGLKPTINMLSIYTIPDDAHKRMPLKNLVIMFHQPLTSLWRKTILSNYEFDTVAEWLNYWFTVRQLICSLADSCCFCISKILSGNPLGRSIKEVIPLCEKLFLMTTGEKLYPREERPFEEKAVIPIQFKNIANKYFQDIRNFSNQFAGFLHKDLEEQRLTMLNLTDAKSTLTKMQDSFSELTIDFDTSEWPSDFTAIETKSIEQLIMYCSYYQVHSPSKYFNKYQIKSWYDKQQQDNLTAVKTALSPLASICSVHFPFQSYVVGILRYYPIIVNNFDTVLKDNSAAFVLNCIEFAEAPFDYLVILSANNSNHINPIALQFSRQMFIDVKKAIRSNDSAALENITYPYPVNVTSSMLDCFIGNYNLLEKSPSAPDLSSIGDIAENLWIYSKSVELLSTPEDADYLASETQRLRTNITEMLQLSRDQLSKKDFDWLVDICNQVFSGKEFDDKLFNDIIEHFTSQAENC